MSQKIRKVVAVAGLSAWPLLAGATNGYFATGFGTAAKSMGGATAALPQDTLTAATNPAGMVSVGDRLDLGLAIFNPSPRGYEADSCPTCPGPSIDPGKVESRNDWFAIPSFGYNHRLGADSAIGVSVGGNGGMNTEYGRAVFRNFTFPANALLDQSRNVVGFDVPPYTAPNNANPRGFLTASSPTGVDLNQLFIGLSYSRKLAPNHSIGITPVFAIQRFKATGLEPFRAASFSPDYVSNNGYDYSYGGGLQVGWFGELSDSLSAGLSYRTTLYMTKFDKYRGLFAEGGKFNIPATLNAGLAYKFTPRWTLAADYQRIWFNDTKAVGNPNSLDLTPCFAPSGKPSFCLGGNNGLGFGWNNMDIVKVGAQWEVSPSTTLRAGISYNSRFADPSQSLFNILAPAVVRTHISAGGTFRLSDRDAVNVAYSHARKETLKGQSPTLTGPQTGSLFMQQNELEVSWSHVF
jgi:long-chain fatty acid transport protein